MFCHEDFLLLNYISTITGKFTTEFLPSKGKCFLEKFGKQANSIPEEEWVYFAPELRNFFNSDKEISDFNPYKAIIYSLIMLILLMVTRKNPQNNYTEEMIESLEKNEFGKNFSGEFKMKYQEFQNLKKLLSPYQNQRPDAIEIFSKKVKIYNKF